MNEILSRYFTNLFDIKLEEFYDFFCLDLSNETKATLSKKFSRIKNNNKMICFDDIGRFFCEEYDEFLNTLDILNMAQEKLEEIFKRISFQGKPFESLMIHKIINYDIQSKLDIIRNMTTSNSKDIDKGFIPIRNKAELSDKLEDLLIQFSKKSNNSNAEITNKITLSLQLNQLQQKIDDLQKQLNNIRSGNMLSPSDNEIDDHRSDRYESLNEDIPYFNNQGNSGLIQNGQNGLDERTDVLTGHVWPKSRMLLAIVSKMSKEGLLNYQQRSMLKDLIIENDSRILQYLKKYELDGNRKNLYKNFLNLSKNK